PRELVSVQFRHRLGTWEEILGGWRYSNYEAYRDRSDVFAALIGFTGRTWTLHSNEMSDRVEGVAVSTDYFATLGIRPALGRLIVPEQGQSPSDDLSVAVISHRLWHRRFAGRADVIGKQILLDDRALTVIGVVPAGFTGTTVGYPADVFVSLGTAAHMEGRHLNELQDVSVLGRLKPGIVREQAQAALQVLDAQMNSLRSDESEIRALVLDGSQGYIPRDARVATYPLALFFGAAALVFVIACANVANLQLTRAIARHKEIAVRQALGAGWWRVLRQLLVESVLLSLAGGVCGILLALCLNRWIYAVLVRIISTALPTPMQIQLSGGFHLRMMLFAMGISLAAGIAFGLTPALAMLRRDVISALKESGGGADLSARRWNSHGLLVVGQIAVAMVVMVFSGLCFRNVVGLQHTDTGYDTRRILVVRFDLEWWVLDRPDLCRFLDDLQERVRRLPGVASAGLALCPPVSGASGGGHVTSIEGIETPLDGELSLRRDTVGPGYFQTLGQALVAGRDFTVQDSSDAPKVMVINEVMAKRYWPNGNPVGKRIAFAAGPGDKPDIREIVGVVKCVKLRSILEEPMPIAYLALAQRTDNSRRITPTLLVRADGDPQPLISAIRKEASAIGTPEALDIRTVSQRIWGMLITQRLLTGILNVFGAVGLLLSAIGIYAVMAYAVRRRTREIGIRIALGARGRDVLASVLLKGTLPMVLGLGLGVVLSLAATRLMVALLPRIREWDEYFLQGVSTWDPLTYVAAALVIVVVALIACYIPARRAAKVDPMVALRCE
ncbi:MAG: ABC transporter permease, partial [Solirubrobacterales bacterium]